MLDGYKFGHYHQFPKGTTMMYSNFTARGSRVEGVDKVVFFGLQYFLKRYLIDDWDRNFFDRPKGEVMAQYRRRYKNYMGSEAKCDHIEALHDLGYLPIEILALPEGSRVNLRVPMLVVYNTHPDHFWISNAIETLLSDTLWLPCTSATTAHMYRQLLDGWAEKTLGDSDFVPFQGHDFSMRGHGSPESAILSGAAHLLSFVGTDAVPAIDFVEKYYNGNSSQELIGCSVNATEHSVACAGSSYGDNGGDDYDYFKRMITEVYPDGIVSLVSDTFDFWQVVTPDGGTLVQLKEEIMKRDGKVVIRPDSGDPVHIVAGYTDDEVEYYPQVIESRKLRLKKTGTYITPDEKKGLIQCLWETFGGTDYAGFKTLDPHIGAIYGDSITLARANEISERLAAKGFSSTNVVYGIGSFTYQGAITPDAIVTRDTYGFAMKATYAEINGEPKALFKDPKTDDGLKKSAVGLVSVYKVGNDYVMMEDVSWFAAQNSHLVPVFKNSQLIIDHKFEDVRNRLKNEK